MSENLSRSARRKLARKRKAIVEHSMDKHEKRYKTGDISKIEKEILDKHRQENGKRGQLRKGGATILAMIKDYRVQNPTAHVSALKKDIPFWVPTFRKSTQVIEVKLWTDALLITTTAATVYTSVQSIIASIFTNFTELATVYDEYRFIGGKVHYYSFTARNQATSDVLLGTCCWVIDYTNSGTLSTFANALSHDTKRVFPLIYVHGMKLNKLGAIWTMPFQLEKLPDQEWISTSTQNLACAYIKPYMPSGNSPGSFSVGFIVVECDMQFRGLA